MTKNAKRMNGSEAPLKNSWLWKKSLPSQKEDYNAAKKTAKAVKFVEKTLVLVFAPSFQHPNTTNFT